MYVHHISIGAGCWPATVRCFVAFWFQALQLGSYKADLKHDFDRGWFSQGFHCHWVWTAKILKAQPADMIRFCVFVNSSSSSILICFRCLSQISPLNDICVQIQAQRRGICIWKSWKKDLDDPLLPAWQLRNHKMIQLKTAQALGAEGCECKNECETWYCNAL